MNLDEDLGFQRRDWRVERAGWAIMALVVLAALAGAFGSGPLSATSSQAGTLAVEYERLWRAHHDMPLKVSLRPRRAGEAVLWIDAAYLGEAGVVSIHPPPVRTEAGAGRISYVFRAADDQPFDVDFRLKIERPGSLEGAIGTPEGDRLTLRHFIYP